MGLSTVKMKVLFQLCIVSATIAKHGYYSDNNLHYKPTGVLAMGDSRVTGYKSVRLDNEVRKTNVR